MKSLCNTQGAILWKDKPEKPKTCVLLPAPSVDKVDSEQVQELQREQGQGRQMAQTYYDFISKPVLSLGIGIQIGVKHFMPITTA